jgi:ankyrin repeat protein
MMIAEKGIAQIAESFIAYGASLDKQNSSRRTALITAVLKGKTDIALPLIFAGASLNLQEL